MTYYTPQWGPVLVAPGVPGPNPEIPTGHPHKPLRPSAAFWEAWDEDEFRKWLRISRAERGLPPLRSDI